ncbi:hypothetical protein HQ489_05265, partial [Candidatus Woesearchaeota archaeon]|nr:hypothetical protein [Candidatus Woesearchaeota archaeon]
CENKEDKEVLLANAQLYGEGLRKGYYYLGEAGELPQFRLGDGPVKYRTVLKIISAHMLENYHYLRDHFSNEGIYFFDDFLKETKKDAIYLTIAQIKKLLKEKIFRKTKRK